MKGRPEVPLPSAQACRDSARGPRPPPEMFARLQILAALLRDAPTGGGSVGRLLWRSEKGEVMALAVTRPIVLGRDPSCDLSLASPRISRRHSAVRPFAARVELEDLASTNGTYVNGVRVRRRVLRNGDVIEMGGVALAYAR